MHILVVGLSHRTAPVGLRERVDFQGRVESALRALASRGRTHEAVVLSTCNRAELYAACEDVGAARADLAVFISDFHGVDRTELAPHVYDLVDLDAARHLLRVSAGLDSLVVGEPQILGQVKEAHTLATGAQTVGPVLNRLFQASFSAGKRVRSETGLAAGAVSVSFAAVALARKIFGDLTGRTVLVIGAGEMGKLTAQHMKSQGVQQVTIVSRTMAHAARTAEAIGGASVAPWKDLDAALLASDIVITATGAGTTILTKAHVEGIMRPRRNRPLFIIDIAVPRDVDSTAGEIEQVFLYNIDDLQATVRENLARRASEVQHAESIVAEEVARFGAWLRSRGAIPTVIALRQKFEAIRRAELERLDFKLSALPPEARPEARASIEEITRLVVEKLLLTPTEQLKRLGDQDTLATYSEALTRLFGLTQPDDSGQEPVARDTPATSSARAEGRVEPFRPKAEILVRIGPLTVRSGIVSRELRLGTRGSQLALWQANAVAVHLKEAGGPACRIVVIKTSGDRLQEAPLSEVGGKRLFVKEIEDALLRDEINLAVHSSKDMPAILPDGLTIGAVLAREDPLDAIVLAETGRGEASGSSRTFEEVVAALGPKPTVGTSSVRRRAQLVRLFPRAAFKPIRGNLDTRLRKLDSGDYDAIVLAAAGLRRLGMASRISAAVPSSACVPAPGQGIVAIEIRQGDASVAAAVRAVDDPQAHAALDAERAVVQALGGGCQTPVGALALPVSHQELELVAVVVALDGSRVVRGSARGTQAEAAAIGAGVGAQLLADGAGEILADAHHTQGAVEGIQP